MLTKPHILRRSFVKKYVWHERCFLKPLCLCKQKEETMAKYLVIVESPAKVKTIKKFLGPNYTVAASQGHVRDLPKSTLGFSPEDDYEPKYITIRGKGEVLAALRKEVKKAEKIYLATDPDREGEAISWHLYHALKLQEKKVYRITFNEITKNAVKESLKNAREIDMDMVDSQQTRRMIDRMVGYRISPLLWAKIKRGLSAGRVQSVALRMICDREEEINAFVPEEYWTIQATLKNGAQTYEAKYTGCHESKSKIATKEEADAILAALEGATYQVADVKCAERTKKAPNPFITSTLQQEASKALNFSTQKTMRLAQQLYEGVDLKGEGTVGLITYLRTDSVRVSDEAAAAASAYISKKFGDKYLAPQQKSDTGNKKIQDAHEAIRPTDITREPLSIKDQLPRDLFRLYQLIWKRFAASRMAEAVYETTTVKIKADKYCFSLAGSKLTFDGFLSVYQETEEEGAEKEGKLKGTFTKDMILDLVSCEGKQHFTQPAPHYTEASLVRALEEQGIGRPSTYAPTIGTILNRHYVVKEQKNLFVTELGEVVNQMMKDAFPTIVDVGFTANMETLLDGVAEGTVKWKTIIANFYPDLDEAVKVAEKSLESVKIADEETEEICESCGRNMVIKYGPHGKFLACPGFPDCRNTKPYFEKIGMACPKCGADVIVKKTKTGRRYYGCMNFTDCDYMVWQRPKTEN